MAAIAEGAAMLSYPFTFAQILSGGEPPSGGEGGRQPPLRGQRFCSTAKAAPAMASASSTAKKIFHLL